MVINPSDEAHTCHFYTALSRELRQCAVSTVNLHKGGTACGYDANRALE